MERKAGSGRRGTIDEEEYLLGSVIKLVGRFNLAQGKHFYLHGSLVTRPTLSGEAASILPHLAQFTAEHYEIGVTLQDHLSRFEQQVKEAVEEIWEKSVNSETLAMSMGTEKEGPRVNPTDKLTKPDVIRHAWQTELL
jgi:elongator complex protein 1